MAWASPQFSRARVDAAGRGLITPLTYPPEWDRWLEDLEVINNWRSSHSFPLNTFQVRLRKKGREIDPDCLVAQRIKRLASISLKLKRFQGLRLSQIQDIGGCRAVVSSVEHANELVVQFRKGDIRHKVHALDNYIDSPKLTGYRGIHLVYKYFSEKSNIYNGLKLEIQIRSQFQHAWATAVETVGTFIQQALKSSMGEAEWLRFFELMGTAVAFQEGCAPVLNTPHDPTMLRDELVLYADALDVIARLEAYRNTLQYFQDRVQNSNAQFHLLELDAREGRVKVLSFERNELERAQQAYLDVEKRIADKPGNDAVLVSVDSVAALQKAYPNYFLDTRVFIGLVNDALQGRPLVIGEPSTPLEAEVVSA